LSSKRKPKGEEETAKFRVSMKERGTYHGLLSPFFSHKTGVEKSRRTSACKCEVKWFGSCLAQDNNPPNIWPPI